MTWPVGKLEQLIELNKLQQRLLEIKSGKTVVLIHSYTEPNQSSWELAYQSQLGSLPIIPGTKLSWYDMKSGYLKTYTTAWDKENGTKSSGTIYPYSSLQNSDYFKYLGSLDVAGYLRGHENNMPSVHFGLERGERIKQKLLCLEVYFRVNMPTAVVANYLYLNYGNIVVQVDVSGVIYRQIEGGPAGPAVAANNTSSQNSLNRLSSIGARPTNATYANETISGCIKILNPFGARTEDGRPSGVSQTSVIGWFFAPGTTYARTSPSAPFSNGAPYRQFSAVKLTQLNMDQYYRIFSTTDNTGLDDNTVRKGRGWAYGYFEDPISSLEEYL